MTSLHSRATNSHTTSCLSSLLAFRSTIPTQSIPISRNPDSLDIWILGSGIASLTAAVHLIREAKVPPSRIHILEALSKAGAGSASRGSADSGYHYRAACIPTVFDGPMEELLLWVPSDIPGKTVWENIRDYFEENIPKQESRIRFLARKNNRIEHIEGKRHNLRFRDRMSLFMLSLKTERALGRSQIRDHFPEGFFRTNYWLMLATMYVDICFKSVADIDDVTQVRFPAES